MNKRLLYILEQHKFLTPAQCGFRKGRSTIDHLIALEAEVLNAFIEGKEAIGIFFDFEKAYDTIRRSQVLEQL
ncbi:reverse transcriptase domain-containing protein, partial [Campylobacter jejuni]|uniref:reverse transcriptase domain-containing protein n=1 Tax=Campylobacter jejuni TaxID=197 RepID=UPI001E61EB4D